MTHTASELAVFCKKKGFIYPSSEIYGSLAGLYDYGHLGTKLKRNFENLWKNYFLGLNDNFYEIETSNIMPEKVFRASGHLENFVDPVMKCGKCEFAEKADNFIFRAIGQKVEGLAAVELDKLVKKNNLKCPVCKADFKEISVLNLMFPVNLGAINPQKAYLRPETAQSPYVNFKLQYELQRKKLPLGLAIIGRAYRNEISPRNLTLRMREFTQAELQIFFNPKKITAHPDFEQIQNYRLRTLLVEDRKKEKVVERTAGELLKKGLPQFYIYHLAFIQKFYLEELKIPPNKFRLYQLDDQEKAFYNQYHFDLEIELEEHGFTEMGGLHYRTDHDLQGHQQISNQNQEVFEEEEGEKFIPHVLELSFGVDRNVYALLDLGYTNDLERGNVVLRLPKKLAPFYCAVFPLVKNKEEITKKAQEVYKKVKSCFPTFYDEVASIGRRYARADENGISYGITIDFDTLTDESVTIRDLDSTKQERIKIKDLTQKLWELREH